MPPKERTSPPKLGSEAYANTLFLVTSDGGSQTIHEDPADAIAEAEENAEAEGETWFVLAVRPTDDPPVHIARLDKKLRKR